MAKGLFTQGVCLLTDGTTAIAGVRAALEAGGFETVKEVPAREHWCFGGPSLIVPFLPDVNGYMAVDVVDQTWPDTMGDPKSEPTLFGAWSMGNFGPLAFPGGLARAAQHAWVWAPGRGVAQSHRGFLRLRLSYVFGVYGDAKLVPERYDPLAEMMFLSRAVLAAFDSPGVLCYFNPNGEALRDRDGFRRVWEQCLQQGKIPLPLWMNVRYFHLNERLSFMDTVGNGQLDIDDVEAVFPREAFDPGDVDYHQRNVTHYLIDNPGGVHGGDAFDGPSDTELSWQCEISNQGVIEPPRRVLRLYPKAERKSVADALAAIGRSQA